MLRIKRRIWLRLWLLVIRFGVRFGTKRQLRGLAVTVWARSPEECEAIFDNLDAALGLIQTHAPVRFQDLRKDAAHILVAGERSRSGSYIPQLRVIELYHKDVLDWSPSWVACLVIHEAQHARLFRLGFDYTVPRRGRIERICIQAEKNFALRLPDGEEMASDADDRLREDLDFIHSTEGWRRGREDRLRMNLQGLEELGLPRWLMVMIRGIYRRRLARITGER